MIALVACGAAASSGTARAASVDAFRGAYERALALYEGGRFEDAIPAFEKAYRIEARPEVLYSMGRCYDKLGRSDEAVVAYERFLAMAPAHAAGAKARGYLFVALRGMGERALAARDFERARGAFARAAELDAPPEARVADDGAAAVLTGLGEALAGLGKGAEAIAALERARASATTPAALERAERSLADARTMPADGRKRPAAKSAWLWVGVAGGAAALTVVVIVIATVAGRGSARPEVDLGWHTLGRN